MGLSDPPAGKRHPAGSIAIAKPLRSSAGRLPARRVPAVRRHAQHQGRRLPRWHRAAKSTVRGLPDTSGWISTSAGASASARAATSRRSGSCSRSCIVRACSSSMSRPVGSIRSTGRRSTAWSARSRSGRGAPVIACALRGGENVCASRHHSRWPPSTPIRAWTRVHELRYHEVVIEFGGDVPEAAVRAAAGGADVAVDGQGWRAP